MLTTLSLISILICSAFLVICHILKKIDLQPSNKGILCFIMISTVGSLVKYEYAGVNFESLSIIALSLFMMRQTYVGYKRGYL